MARSALRCTGLRQSDPLRVSQGKAGLRTVPDRSAYSSEHRDLPADIAVEPDGLAGDPGELACDPDREFDPLYIAAVLASGARTLARAQARDRGLWLACRHERDACRGVVGTLRRNERCAGNAGRCNGNAKRKPGGQSGTEGARTLQTGNGAVEVWGLGRLRQADRRDARSFRGHEPAMGRSLRCVRGFINAKPPSHRMSIPPNFARPSRRGDRVKMGTSEFGTSRRFAAMQWFVGYRG